jgi:drug/metabolite transporter (DMT)-like permease
MLVMSVAMTVLGGVVLGIGGSPGRLGWAYGVVSGVLHIGYNLCLVRMYRSGDLSQTYPVARGVSPMLVALGGALFAGEHLNGPGLLGVLLVSVGILALALRQGRLDLDSVPAALATGGFIGAYSVTDGLGVRAASDPIGFIGASNMLGGAMTVAVLVALPRVRRAALSMRRPDVGKSLAGGAASMLAYATVIWALGHAPMGAVSALRETSVVFAALLGRIFLAERLTARRMAACCVIALGAACLGLAGAPR